MNETKPNFAELARDAFPGWTVDVVETIASIGERGYEHGLAGWYKEGDYSSDADYCYGVGAEIQRLEDEHGIDDGAVHDFFVECHGQGLEAHERECQDPACCTDKPRIELDNLDREDESVLVTMACPDARKIGREMQGPSDARWETSRDDPNFAYAVVSDRPDLVQVLIGEGYIVETADYVAPSH